MAIHTLKPPPLLDGDSLSLAPSLAEGVGGGFNTQNNTQFLNLDCHESLRDSSNDRILSPSLVGWRFTLSLPLPYCR